MRNSGSLLVHLRENHNNHSEPGGENSAEVGIVLNIQRIHPNIPKRTRILLLRDSSHDAPTHILRSAMTITNPLISPHPPSPWRRAGRDFQGSLRK